MWGHPDRLRWWGYSPVTCPVPSHPGVGHLLSFFSIREEESVGTQSRACWETPRQKKKKRNTHWWSLKLITMATLSAGTECTEMRVHRSPVGPWGLGGEAGWEAVVNRFDWIR